MLSERLKDQSYYLLVVQKLLRKIFKTSGKLCGQKLGAWSCKINFLSGNIMISQLLSVCGIEKKCLCLLFSLLTKTKALPVIVYYGQMKELESLGFN